MTFQSSCDSCFIIKLFFPFNWSLISSPAVIESNVAGSLKFDTFCQRAIVLSSNKNIFVLQHIFISKFQFYFKFISNFPNRPQLANAIKTDQNIKPQCNALSTKKWNCKFYIFFEFLRWKDRNMDKPPSVSETDKIFFFREIVNKMFQRSFCCITNFFW